MGSSGLALMGSAEARGTRPLVGFVVAAGAALCGLGAARAEPAAETTLLTEQDSWRKHYTFSPPVVASGETAPVTHGPKDRLTSSDGLYTLFAAPPPKSWTEPDFDDRHWLLAQGSEFEHGPGAPRAAVNLKPDAAKVYLRCSDPAFPPVGLICQRSRFAVRDRRQVGQLTLSLTYRGGFVAHLNGWEVARGGMPPGRVAPPTPSVAYPLEAFFRGDSLERGRPQHLQPNAPSPNQWPQRERTHGPAPIPTETLRDGVNVLAIEFHRSVYPDECKRHGIPCATAGLSLLELRATAEAGAVPAPDARPSVWGVELTRTVFDPAHSLRVESGASVAIEAARNGTFSGQVVVTTVPGRGGKPLEGLSARVSALRQVGGDSVVPATAVRIRYGAANPFWPKALSLLGFPAPPRWQREAGVGDGTRFDVLLDAPPADAASVAVWVSVRTPKDVPAGDYTGELSVAVKGTALNPVPVRLRVADWTLPDVRDYASVINLYQSPETLAAHYKVEPWSEAHWRLIEGSMRLMGGMGNIGLFIPLLAESQMGNAESMVPWIRRPDGSYTYDFTVFDRYVATAMKHHDRLRFISLNVWGYEAATRTWRGPRDYASFYGARATVVDPATGRKTSMKLPRYGTPECEALWRPLLLALRDRLKAKGIEEKIVLGLAADLGPEPDTAAMFHRILPDAGWIAESHQLNRPYVYDTQTKAAVPVRYNSIVYGADVPDPAARRLYGWQQRKDVVVMNFNRSGSCLLLIGYPPPWSFRMWMESTLVYGRAGNGRVGGDYWHLGAELLGEGERGWGVVGGSGGTFFGRYLHSHADEAGLGRSCTDLFGPGPDGPVTTVRLENAREGIQETEARIFIEKALVGSPKRLPPERVREWQAMLDERTHVLRLWKLGAADIAPFGWQERTRRLFDAAAQVARALDEER